MFDFLFPNLNVELEPQAEERASCFGGKMELLKPQNIIPSKVLNLVIIISKILQQHLFDFVHMLKTLGFQLELDVKTFFRGRSA